MTDAGFYDDGRAQDGQQEPGPQLQVKAGRRARLEHRRAQRHQQDVNDDRHPAEVGPAAVEE